MASGSNYMDKYTGTGITAVFWWLSFDGLNFYTISNYISFINTFGTEDFPWENTFSTRQCFGVHIIMQIS